MDVTPLVPQGQQIIQSYSAGKFRVNNIVYEGAVIVMPEAAWAWDVSSFEGLRFESFQLLIERAPQIDVVLLGCGQDMALPAVLRQELKARGLVVETMDTGAACRTYNVLMAEGRRVAAALLPI